MIIEMDMYAEIRKRYNNGESIRSIARAIGVSRQTVAKYCEGSTHPELRKPYERSPEILTKDVENFILSCFEIDRKEGPKKQQHTAKRIYDRLVEEKSFEGSYSSIRSAVRKLRELSDVPSQSKVPLSYEPGEAIQIDWGEVTVYENNQKYKFFLFCGRLCYSCDIFVQAYRSSNEESFLEAQQKMFGYFGGIPKRIIFDNAKVAVKEGFGLYAKPQARYLSFSAHYAFELDFCNPGKGNEKGLVENLVGYARRNFFVPIPRVSSIEELNNQLLKSCLRYREQHRVEGRTNPVSVLYREESQFLHPIPPYQYDTSKTIVTRPDDFSTVRFEKNFYSVPTKYIGQELTVKGYANDVSILYDGAVITNYPRVYGSKNTQYHLEHYLDLLEIKPRSVFNARPVKETLTRELLEWGSLLPGGNREMVKLLRLCVDYGEEKILAIKNMIPTHIVPTVDMIRSYLHEPVEVPVVYLSNEITVLQADLTMYDKKCGVTIHG